MGAGSVVLQSVPSGATVVGIPGRVVFHRGKKVTPVDLNHEDLPDPVAQMFNRLQNQLDELRLQLESCCYYREIGEEERSDQAI